MMEFGDLALEVRPSNGRLGALFASGVSGSNVVIERLSVTSELCPAKLNGK
jgi:hypothetical protein